MELESLIKDLPQSQRGFLLKVAMKNNKEPHEVRALSRQTSFPLKYWLTQDRFVNALRYVVETDCVAEAVQQWFGDKLNDYVNVIHNLATGGEVTDKIKLEAAKFAIGLARKTRSVESSLTREYSMDGSEKTTERLNVRND